MKQSSMGKSRKTAGRKTVRLLMTCIGRRVELLNAFRRAAETLDIDLEIHGADLNKMSPAINLVDKAHFVDRISSGKYIKQLLGVVRKQKIDLLIPLIDTELALLADAASQFEKAGCLALVSSPGVIETCSDKLATYCALSDAGIDTPVTWTWRESLKLKKHKFPMFLKPRAGSAGMGNYKISTLAELKTFGKRVPDAIVQEFVDGDEYTLDVYTGFDGVPRCAVPRKRLEVRTGEVSKAVIVKDEKIMAIGRRVAEVLGACRGVVTVQMMRNKRGRIRVIEINPRFGGGAPLAIHAGADFPKWILMALCGKKPRISKTCFRDDVAMLRYDESVFVAHASR